MFYSHEILTSKQYGVATIWLIATGCYKSSYGKINRKTIQSVDVQKACDTILEPGAPIALRLQGSLLYGVSRVYKQQCDYMLTDIEKVRASMSLFASSQDQLDPKAGQTKAANLLIMNDPAFIPEAPLPFFDLDSIIASSQQTNKTSTQMSPPDTQVSWSSGKGGFLLNLDIEPSQSSISLHNSPFEVPGFSSAQKEHADNSGIRLADPFKDGEYSGAGDWGMDIDEEGNIIESHNMAMEQDALELPPLPTENTSRPVVDEQGDVFMMEDVPRADPGSFPGSQQAQVEHSLGPQQQEHNETTKRVALKRTRKPRVIPLDPDNQVEGHIVKSWRANYLENCSIQSLAGRKFRSTSTGKKPRQNAAMLTFGHGIFNIGQSLDLPGQMHPLAVEFSGDSLVTAFTGINITTGSGGGAFGQHRLASEPIDDGEDEQGRRVRPRLEDNDDGLNLMSDGIQQQQQQQPVYDDPFFSLGSDNLPLPFLRGSSIEIGREGQEILSDRQQQATLMSSALRGMPWNRGSSADPTGGGSGGGFRGGSHHPSRLGGSSSTLGRGEREVEGVGAYLPSDIDTDMADNEQGLLPPLPHSSLGSDDSENFLAYVTRTIDDVGEHRHEMEDLNRRRKWVAFDDLLLPRTTVRGAAVAAFYHCLTLATRGRMDLEQEGEEMGATTTSGTSRGAIWLGVRG